MTRPTHNDPRVQALLRHSPDPSIAVRFTVLGKPQQKGSKRVLPVRGPRRFVVRDANEKAGPWALCVSQAAREAYQGDLLRSPVVVRLEFYFARPKGHYGTGRNANALKPAAPSYMTSTPDVDKLARCALDALMGVVIYDDSQVVDLVAIKGYGEPERLEVGLRELRGDGGV